MAFLLFPVSGAVSAWTMPSLRIEASCAPSYHECAGGDHENATDGISVNGTFRLWSESWIGYSDLDLPFSVIGGR